MSNGTFIPAAASSMAWKAVKTLIDPACDKKALRRAQARGKTPILTEPHANSSVHNDAPGALAAVAGFQLASVGTLGNLIPYAGFGFTLATTGRDVKEAHADHKSYCTAGH
ncbi:MAG: hypothetical protein ABI322_01910 [Gemmatimonadaceae bacterium]